MFKGKKIETVANNYETENSSSNYYFKPKHFNSAEIIKSNLKRNVQEAFDYVNNCNNINPLKFDFNSIGKNKLKDVMNINLPKRDN